MNVETSLVDIPMFVPNAAISKAVSAVAVLRSLRPSAEDPAPAAIYSNALNACDVSPRRLLKLTPRPSIDDSCVPYIFSLKSRYTLLYLFANDSPS